MTCGICVFVACVSSSEDEADEEESVYIPGILVSFLPDGLVLWWFELAEVVRTWEAIPLAA